MKITTRILASLQHVYSLALLAPVDSAEQPALAAGSEGDSELLFFEPPSYSPRAIASQPGGFMSLSSFQKNRRRYLLASTNFKPGFKGENCKIVLYDLDGGKSCIPYEVASLPFAHRIFTAKIAGQLCLLASTLCAHKDFKEDWTHPGAIYFGMIPHRLDLEWVLHPVICNLNKNHGFDYACLYPDTSGGFLISAMEGLFYAQIPPRIDIPWESELIAGGEHSDAFAFDWDGSGFPQVFAISPFHGNTLSIYCKQDGQWQRRIIDDGVEMGHVLWAGRFLGRPVLIVGSRAGRKELAIYRADESHRIGFRKEVIDEGVGATQMVVIDRGNNETWLFIAGHGRNEVLLYQITD